MKKKVFVAGFAVFALVAILFLNSSLVVVSAENSSAPVCGTPPEGTTINAPTSTDVAYDMDAVDSEMDACSANAGAGAELGDHGCCGGGKLRTSGEKMCMATYLCDGQKWHDSAKSDQEGEVFMLPPDSGIPFPVANVGVNKPLVMCVDGFMEQWMLNLRASAEAYGCLPDFLDTARVTAACAAMVAGGENCSKNKGQPGWASAADYVCPAAYYYAGGNGVLGAGGICRQTGSVDDGAKPGKPAPLKYGSGYLVCTGAYDNHDYANMWGHAYFMAQPDTGVGFTREWPFNEDVTDSSRCPSAIATPWHGAGDWEGNQPATVTIMPCPGKVPVTVTNPSYAGPFGSSVDRSAFVCLQKGTGNLYNGFFSNLNWVVGSPTAMGTVKKHGYMCDTKPLSYTPPTGLTRAYVAICCGRQGCGDIPGRRDARGSLDFQPGQYINMSFGGIDPFTGRPRASATYKVFCRSDGSWDRDLDNDSYACERAGYVWTGGFCCGEAGDDSNLVRGYYKEEFYNDNSSSPKGICFNNQFKTNNLALTSTNAPQSVLISGGQSYGCNAGTWKYNSKGYQLPRSEFQISEKQNGVTLPSSSALDVAFSQASDALLAVWNNDGSACSGFYCPLVNSTQANGQGGVFGQLIRGDGFPLGSNFKLGGSALSKGVKVAYASAGDVFLVVWNGPDGLRASVVRPDGTFVKKDFSLISDSCEVSSDTVAYRQFVPASPGLIFGPGYGKIAYSQSADKFIVTCTKKSDSNVLGVFVTPAGDKTGTFSLSPGFSSSVAVGDSTFLVTWKTSTGKQARLLRNDGSFASDALAVDNKVGDVIAFFNPAREEYDVFFNSISPEYYSNESALKKRILNETGTALSSELLIHNSSLYIDRIGDEIFPAIRAMSYSSERNSYFFLTGARHIDGGVAIYEIKPDGSVSYSADLVNLLYIRHDAGLRIKDVAITIANGAPFSLFSRNRDVLGQFAALTPISAPDWPNPPASFGYTKEDLPLNQTNQTNVTIVRPKGQLVDVFDSCSLVNIGSLGQRFCDVDGVWKSSGGQNKSYFSMVPSELFNYLQSLKPNQSMTPMACCLPNQCWDPLKNACIKEQLGFNDSYFISQTNTTYKCLNGIWGKQVGLRYTPDGCTSGFCPSPGQCFYDPKGLPAQNGNVSGKPQCVFNGQFINDNYCLNGSWGSRTRLAAITLTRLLKSANENFVLTCGTPGQVLIKTQNPGLVNSVCVLDLKPGTPGNKRIIATSLNQELELPQGNDTLGKDFIYALKQSFWGAYPGASFASVCLNRTGFDFSCVEGKTGSMPLLKLYYDNSTKVIVFSDKEISDLTPTLLDYLCDWFPPWMQWLCPSPPPIATSLTNLTFDRLYSARVNSKEELGIQKDRCECAGCAKVSSYAFDYKGYSRADLVALLGTPEVFNADLFYVNEPVPRSVNVLIKNPRVSDKNALWSALGFIKGNG